MTGLLAALALVALVGLSARALLRAGSAARQAEWGAGWLNRLDGVNRLFCRHYHRLHPVRLPVPEEGPALVAANHVSGLDPLLLLASSPRPLRFLIAREEYERPGLSWLFRAVGCIPVDRSARPEQALRAALRALTAGEVVALFPHGRIHLDGAPLRPLKPGVVWLAQRAGCPVLPARIEGVRGEGRVLPAVLLRSRAVVRVYPPVACEGKETEACLAAIAEAIEGRR